MARDVLPNLVVLTVDRYSSVSLCVLCAPVRVIHHKRARAVENLVPGMVRGAQRCTIITRRGLDIDFSKRRSRTNLTVRDAVHPASAGEAKSRVLRPFPKAVQYMERTLFEERLDRGSDVLLSRAQSLVFLPRGPEQPL